MNLTFLLASAKKIAFVRRDTLVLSDGDKKKDQNQVILTPTDGALADDMILSGLLGLDIRAKIISTGTYAGGTTITVEGN